MKTIWPQKDATIRREEQPKPSPKGSNVVVKMKSLTFCGHPGKSFHEGAGEVAEIDQASYLKAGDRVNLHCFASCGRCRFCLGGDWILCKNHLLPFGEFGKEYLLWPEHCCFKTPEDFSNELTAILLDGLGTPFGGIKKLTLQKGEYLGIFGVGPIGLGATLLTKHFGCRVIAVDLNEYRLNLAKEIGADYILNPNKDEIGEKIKEITEGKGIDKTMECAGNEKATNMALDSLKTHGEMVFIGENKEATVNPSDQWIRKELTVRGSWGLNVSYYEELVRIVRANKEKAEKIMTHKFPLDQAEKAMQVFASKQCGKVIINFPE